MCNSPLLNAGGRQKKIHLTTRDWAQVSWGARDHEVCLCYDFSLFAIKSSSQKPLLLLIFFCFSNKLIVKGMGGFIVIALSFFARNFFRLQGPDSDLISPTWF